MTLLNNIMPINTLAVIGLVGVILSNSAEAYKSPSADNFLNNILKIM
jgi:hypothetical protein